MKRPFGLDKGFDFYDDSHISSINGRLAQDVTDTALEWLRKTSGLPRLLFLNYFDPHWPYFAPDGFAQTFVPGGNPPPGQPYASREQMAGLYDAEILYMDHHLGRFLYGLKRLGIYEKSWIIITSDHGELLGEHGQIRHGKEPYQEVVHIPLIVKEPGGQPRSGRRDNWIQLVDILPMLWDYLELELPPNIQGEVPPNITHPIVIESRTLPAVYPGGDWLALIRDGKKLFLSSKGKRLLFDLATDPREEQNLYDSHRAQADAMQVGMNQYLASLPAPGPERGHAPLDQGTVEALRGLGYVQ
jgi:arylsulfatase A-like enzyme